MFNNLTLDQYGYLKIAGGVAFMLAVGVPLWILISLRPVFDEQLCIVDTAPPGHRVLVFDISEPEDAYTLASAIRDQSEDLPQYHRLSVYRIADLNETPTAEVGAHALWPLVRVFSACNPGRGDQVNWMITGSKYAEKRYRSLFAEPIDKMIEETAALAGSATSPIMDALAQVPDIEHFGSQVTERTLQIRSDFLQHTLPQYTHYTADIKDVDYALNRIGVVVPNLAEFKVQVDFVQRTQYVRWQNDKHREFWNDYFSKATNSSRDHSALIFNDQPGRGVL